MSSLPIASPEILLATDFGELAQRALACARQIARLRDAPLRALHVVDLMDASAARHSSFSEAHDSAQRGLRRIQRELRLAGMRGTATLITSGSAPHAIHDAVARYKPAMLVLGLHGEMCMFATSIGATAKSLLRRADYPVLTVGTGVANPTSRDCERVLLIADNAPQSLEAATHAWPSAENHAPQPLWVVLPPDFSPQPGSVSEDQRRFNPVSLLPHVDAADQMRRDLPGLAPGLVIVSLRARGYLDSLTPRSVLHTLITRAPCPVLTIRG